ncbi:hypothetical protein HKX48_000525 [Thoreauomyces humboldtii]|nr:hypothetical protein HKX48_000525 [Thoreauomyces humboldtii]
MVVWAGNGRVFSGDVSGCVKGWDTSTGQCIANFEGLAPITTFTLGRDLLYVATSLGTISVIDIESGQTLRTLRVRQQHNDDARSQNVVSLCLARGRLYSLSRDGLVSEWDVKRGRAVRSANAAMGPAVALCSAGRGDVLVVCSGTVVQLPPAERERPGTEDHALGPSDSASNVASDAPDDVVALKRQLAAMRVLQSQQQQIAQQQAHSTASSLLARAEDAELALQAAKELLVSYRSELELTQQAHAYAFSYLSQSSNRTWFEIEREIRGLHEIMSEPIPRPGGEDGDLEDFCPKRKAKRCWQRDDLWDSDADEDDANAIGGGGDGEPPWWRVETGRTNLADLKWWREEQPSRPAITVPSVEPYAIPELTMMAMDDNDDSDDDQDLTEEIGERSSFSDDELGTDEADHPTPHPTIRVRGTFRLPDGSIQITPSTAPAFPVPRRITVPAATAIAAARSLATSPPRTSPHNSAVSRQRIRTPTRESRRRSAAPAAAVAVVTPTPSATGSSSKRTSSASWFAPIQNWVETVVAGAAEPQNGDVASSGGSEAGGTVAPPLSSAGSAGTEVKKVRVRTADVYRFEEGMVNPS